jgi:pyruvate/2-oxoglutarate/acetoin dehydrogenase E1 component
LLGEDILDPYGGAFKVTRGLSTKFPERVLTTPISESALVGIASGMALRGLRPVAEIMFGDFITLITDQLVNHAAKFRWMYNDNVRVPIVIRAPMGGRRGYGPTHSQSLEKMFLGVPGLKVIAPNTLGDPGQLLEDAIADDEPVLFVEHKLLYTRPMLESGRGDLIEFEVQQFGITYPNFVLSIPNHIPQLELLMEHEIFAEIVLFSQLSPFDLSPLFDSLHNTRKLLTIEEGTQSLGWGAEVLARVVEHSSDLSRCNFRRVAARDLPIANSRTLEDATLPSVHDIVEAALTLTS